MKRKRRILSLLLSGAMLFSLCTPTVFAETPTQYSGQSVTEAGGLCEHHAEHTEDCGYSPATAGTPCGYVCELCGARDNTPSNAEAVTVASVQAMIDALPNAEEITEDNAEDVKAQLDAIDEAKEKLSDEEIDELDMTRYAEAAAVLGALAAPMLLADDSPAEQFSLTPGGRYYFDLSGANIPGTANSGNSSGAASLPDTSLHYVPFTYAGTIEAYKLTSAMATTEEYAQQNKYAHSLFVADYNVTHKVSWDDLNAKSLIFGKDYAAGGVGYTLRAPSVESGSTGSDDSERGTPQSNEWDMMLNKNSGYVQNWNKMSSQGQDACDTSIRASRGYLSARLWTYHSSSTRVVGLGFRPVLEVLNADTLNSDGLKVVTLDLGGGKLGGSSDDIQIIVKNGSAFTAPASDGLTRPDGNTGSSFMWLGSNGKLYAPGDNVPAEVTTLTAQWTAPAYTVTLNTNGGTIADGKDVTGYTYGVGATLPTDVTRTGYTFKGWYDNENLTGSPVTAIGDTETGNKAYWANWRQNSSTGGGSYYPYTPSTPSKPAAPNLDKTKTDSTTAINAAATANKYDAAEQAEVKKILDKANADIKNAKTEAEVKAIEEAAQAEIDKILTTEEKAIVAALDNVEKRDFATKSKVITRKGGKKVIRLTWTAPDGVDVDGYEIFRSTKKNSGFGTKPYFETTNTSYTNTKALKAGKTYYYKVRAFVVINGERVYTDYSLKANRKL